MLVARMLAAVAANESDSKRRRGCRKVQEMAEAGRPHGGGARPFGFQPDRITHDAHEAQTIHDLAVRAQAGESLTSLCRRLTDEGTRTVTGKEWRTPITEETTRVMLLFQVKGGLTPATVRPEVR
jgi:DNA invertase Pin-like site-specific DNA recombinase